MTVKARGGEAFLPGNKMTGWFRWPEPAHTACNRFVEIQSIRHYLINVFQHLQFIPEKLK